MANLDGLKQRIVEAVMTVIPQMELNQLPGRCLSCRERKTCGNLLTETF